MKTQLRPVDPRKAKEYFEDKITFTTGPVELDHMIKEDDDINLVDAREPEAYEEGHIPGAVNLPREKWHPLEGLQGDKATGLYWGSQVCHLAATAAVEFA